MDCSSGPGVIAGSKEPRSRRADVASPPRIAPRLLRGARAAALALAALAVLALAVPVQAQTTYVSNIGQSADAATLAISSFTQGQGFTTGTDTGGYMLGSVDIRLESVRATESTGSQIPTVTIVQGTPTGTVVATLTKPASLPANLNFESVAELTC